MKWFSFIFRHGLLVAVVVGIAIAYVYRYQLFPRFFEQETVITVASNEVDKPNTLDAKTAADQITEVQQEVQTSVEEKSASLTSDLTSNQPLPSVELQSTEATVMKNAQTEVAAANTNADVLQNQSVKSNQASSDATHTNANKPTKPDEAVKPASGTSTATAQTDSKASPGLMVDPMSTMSGMIKNPAQSMSGMMNNPVQASKQAIAGAEKPQDESSVQTPPVKAPQYQPMNRPMASPPMSTRMPAQAPSQTPQYQPMNRPMASPPMSTRMPAQAPSQAPQSQPMNRPMASPPMSTRMPAQAPSQAPQSQPMNRPMASPPMSARMPAQAPTGTGRQIPQQAQQLISMARKAYWQGQYEQSENYYKQAIEAEPANPDSYGELGNVYYSQGLWDESGENLYQSAIRLLDQNRPDKAYNMLSIIQGLKHKRGAELETRLQEFQSKKTR